MHQAVQNMRPQCSNLDHHEENVPWMLEAKPLGLSPNCLKHAPRGYAHPSCFVRDRASISHPGAISGWLFGIRLSSVVSTFRRFQKVVDTTNSTMCSAENTLLKDALSRSQILRRLKQRTA